MPLSAGDKLGHYEVLSLLGQGGMGEVYRARDTTLKRDVALKVLPATLLGDAERMTRFQREAEVLASLDHPNIGPIYGIIDSEESRGLVLALIEGPTLADQIALGPLPLEDALSISRQIIEALEYAHDRGVVHRDLKPANIKITPEGVVKVLDFGLAKVLEDEPPKSSLGNSPTMTLGHTRAGVILGTAAYMSPEQAIGRPVDRRSDIFSFGAVLYEMLAGKRAFGGTTTPDVLETVVKNDPDWSLLPAGSPGYLRRLLERTLAKDRKQRLQAIGEARIVLENPSSTGFQPAAALPGSAEPPRHRWLWPSATAIAILLAATLTFQLWHVTRPVEHPMMRLSVDLGPDSITGQRTTAAISPDGTRIAFPARGPGGTRQLATQLLDQATPTVLSGTDGAADPFFSPDGQWIGFSADRKLKKISVLGGAAVALCDARSLRGASWGDDGKIIAALDSGGGLWRIPAAGGTPEKVTSPPQNTSQRWPHVLPESGAVLFADANGFQDWDNANIVVLSLKTGQTKTLLQGGYFPRYLPSGGSTGHLVYVHNGVLFGVLLDTTRLEVRGTPVPLIEDVAGDSSNGGGQFDVSRSGTLVYLSGKPSTAGAGPIVWLDSSGKTQPLLAKPGFYDTPRFSPDGNLLALSARTGNGQDLYVYDWRHDTMPRLTFNGLANRLPAWTPDGKHIAFSSLSGLWWVRADGAGEPQKLLESKKLLFVHDVSPDGKRIVYAERTPETNPDLWTLPLDLSDPEHPKPGQPEPLLSGRGSGSAFSPDGRWIAYVSTESGHPEVYVRPFPGPGGKWQISSSGGSVPTWSRDGRQLFYASPDRRIMMAEYTAKGDAFSYSKPRLWSVTQIADTTYRYFDIAPDGKRFAVFPVAERVEEKEGNVHVTFLLNFFDEVRRRVPSGK